jgi:tRNA nucleotidyltransferase (CCA-adding enzyme)
MLCPDYILALCHHIQAKNGVLYVVGGAVRDYLNNRPITDWDLELCGLSLTQATQVLSKLYDSLIVHEKFGVIQLSSNIQITLPRLERNTGLGHYNYTIRLCPFISLKQAAIRRDFTINALYFNPLTQQLLDPTDQGLSHTKNNWLHPVCPQKFPTDPVRILRAAAFIGRFNCTPSPLLIDLCTEADLTGLRPNHKKHYLSLIQSSAYAHAGLAFLKRINVD